MTKTVLFIIFLHFPFLDKFSWKEYPKKCQLIILLNTEVFLLKKLIVTCLCASFLLTGCQTSEKETVSSKTEKYSTQIFAMDTVMDISVYDQDDSVLTEVSDLIKELDHNLSTTNKESEIYKLNQEKQASLSKSTSELLQLGLTFCQKTNGALDLSIYPVVQSWGFTTDTYRIPSPDEIHTLLENVDYSKILFSSEEQSVSIPEQMEIDLGSVAKGYTGNKIVELLKNHGITSALLNLGGNVQVLGNKPDGSSWNVGIQDPLSDDYLGSLFVTDSAVITSGGYERYFEDENGNVYWHIIDPSTGYPARSGLISATAIGPDGAYCDALSTSLFIMGKEKAEQFWKENQDFEMILISENKEVFITSGIADSFQLMDHSPYSLNIISPN